MALSIPQSEMGKRVGAANYADSNILRCSLDRNKGNVTKNPFKETTATEILVTVGTVCIYFTPRPILLVLVCFFVFF